MEYSLLVRNHEIEFNGTKYKFKSPIIYDFLEFTEALGSGDIKQYPKLIKSIVDIKEDDITITIKVKEIIEKIIAEVYPDSGNTGGGTNNTVFFPANIDYIASSYGMHPIDFLKKTTINQMEAIGAAKEWNGNIKNSEEHKNKGILTRQLGKQFEEDAKERIRLKFNKTNKG